MTDLGGAFLVEHLEVGGVRVSADHAGITLRHPSHTVALSLDLAGVGKLMDFLRSCTVNRFNRRRSFRIPVEPGAGLEVEVSIAGVTHGATTGDVSFTGILLEPREGDRLPLTVGDVITITLRLGDDCVTLRSSVRREALEGVGVHFLDSLRAGEVDPVPDLARLMAKLERLWLAARVSARLEPIDSTCVEPTGAAGDAFASDTGLSGALPGSIAIGDVIVRDSEDTLCFHSASQPEVQINFDIRGVGALFDFLRSSSVNPANRRRGFRIPLVMDDGVRATIRHGPMVLEAAPLDVSLSGALLHPRGDWPEEIPIGTAIEVRLHLDDECATLAAAIRRRAGAGYGVEFTEAVRGEELTPPANLARMIARLERRWLAEYVAAA